MQIKFEALPRSYFDRGPTEVAQYLLGKLLVRRLDNQLLVGKIVETEAYLPSGDSAAHNFKGKTKRNESLYKDAGHAYVHSMRQYCLLDVVTEGPDVPGSVLIRALEPIEGIDEMQKARREDSIERLTNGPGKVCAAFGITRSLDGTDMTDSANDLFISESNETISEDQVVTTSRIGISTAMDMPLRFHLYENNHVSKRR